ncbi:MAG: hypothetical protein ACRDBM_06725, partial [Sporomusa sp.]
QVAGSDLIVVNKADLAGLDTQQIIDDLLEIETGVKVVIASAANEMPGDVIEEIISCDDNGGRKL